MNVCGRELDGRDKLISWPKCVHWNIHIRLDPARILAHSHSILTTAPIVCSFYLSFLGWSMETVLPFFTSEKAGWILLIESACPLNTSKTLKDTFDNCGKEDVAWTEGFDSKMQAEINNEIFKGCTTLIIPLSTLNSGYIEKNHRLPKGLEENDLSL